MARPTDPGAVPAGPQPRPRKRFGQHFLASEWVTKLVDALEPASGETFLEIGPGRGALTLALAPRVGALIAVEIDRDLALALPARLPAHARVICGDFLSVNLETLLKHKTLPVRVVGNLPYNVSSPILFALLSAADHGRRLSDATVMLQKEVADRLAAQPGDRDYGALAIQAAYSADVERVMVLPPGAFRPPPKVWSAVVRLTFRPTPFAAGPRPVFERIVRGVFLQRRKTLANALKPVADSFNLKAAELIEKAGLDASSRPEALAPEAFGRLSLAVL